ncbi:MULTISPECIES: hypothetical protein [Winogradskyella]|uniref:hypothetical protein n=1 Tax=Winogradskyella TaxID=286104 RepID=UPI0015CDC748|nr:MULTISPECIES: hypothetical protein [Winogradskyella]QNK78215.1 hypothetical protein H7F37_03790 [Winogradskyella sp. PAMC22761]QNK78274.1 hypothetical protein H7F37_04095 [Winogradskyella sp. PAMC22761]QXP78779.1 hypothetical protein H0I32_16480 [Winogradskyella sp. HaHa_3_26]QXP78821.1 hypothetical protein H0I32_16695 [Winogradskyella sp. HaHa_3_26]
MTEKEIKKIKSQKNAAIILIIVPIIMLISYLGKTNFNEYGLNNYIICGALVVLMICGAVGLKNSLRKQKNIIFK